MVAADLKVDPVWTFSEWRRGRGRPGDLPVSKSFATALCTSLATTECSIVGTPRQYYEGVRTQRRRCMRRPPIDHRRIIAELSIGSWDCAALAAVIFIRAGVGMG
jgi:hypothetical protein